MAFGMIAVIGGLILGGAALGTSVYQGAKRGEPWFPGKDAVQEPANQLALAALAVGALILLMGAKRR